MRCGHGWVDGDFFGSTGSSFTLSTRPWARRHVVADSCFVMPTLVPKLQAASDRFPGTRSAARGNCSPPRLPVQPIVLGRPRRARLAIPPTEHFMRDRLGSHREMLDSERNLAQAVGTTRSLIRRAHHTGWPSRGAIKLSADRHGPIVGLPGPRY
jgi:hypothetical protein